jgi:rsbT antagonist protein RsbS
VSVEQIAILKLNGFLLVTIQVEMHDKLVMRLQDDLTRMLANERSRGVLIDISALDMVDSFIARSLGQIAAISRVMDATTVLTGMKPAVAITLVDLGISLKGIRTAVSIDGGMEILHAAAAARD